MPAFAADRRLIRRRPEWPETDGTLIPQRWRGYSLILRVVLPAVAIHTNIRQRPGRLQGSEQAEVDPDTRLIYLGYLCVGSFAQGAAARRALEPGTPYKGQPMRANSLARLNMLPVLGTPVADENMARFRVEWGYPAHASLLFDLARGIELVHCLERAVGRVVGAFGPCIACAAH